MTHFHQLTKLARKLLINNQSLLNSLLAAETLMNPSSVVDLLRPLVVLAVLIATVFILFVASKILIPIALGILLSFVLNPAVMVLTRRESAGPSRSGWWSAAPRSSCCCSC
jgi:hypothetical protein